MILSEQEPSNFHVKVIFQMAEKSEKIQNQHKTLSFMLSHFLKFTRMAGKFFAFFSVLGFGRVSSTAW